MLAKSISGAAAAASPVFVEDTFSSYLYTGTGATQTITNGIDLSGKGGLVWIKGRSGATGHRLTDTARGATKSLESNSAAAAVTESTGLTAFNGTGFSIGADADYNTNTATYASWTFREQAKFFDVVTYTGNGAAGRTVTHNLGSTPGCIIVKCISTGYNWAVWHRSVPTQKGFLNLTSAFSADTQYFDSTGINSTQIKFATDTGEVNQAGDTYVAYLFAHDAGGFGLTGTDNVISCGSYTGNGSSGQQITLGYETQWVMTKAASTTSQWKINDVIRGQAVEPANSSSGNPALFANQSFAEAITACPYPTATGFNTGPNENASGQTYIYIAIRRGPMKVPTSGTSVFSPIASSSSQGTKQTTGFPVDLQIADHRNAAEACRVFDRLRGFSTTPTSGNAQRLITNSTDAESADTSMNQYFDNTGFQTGSNYSGISSIFWNFRRAPGFFDVVAYTGTGANRTVNHNLAAVPEMMIVKRRDSAADWWVYDTATGNTKYQVLNSTATPVTSSTAWNNTTPTSSVFTVGTGTPVNASGGTYIAYLFATVTGVSKVGSYTGNGTSQTINCSFTGGSRFILIKRTDATGDWYVWDTARGIVAANDPRLSLNTTAAEVTTDDSIDTNSTGFIVNQVAATNINVSAATYIFLAIA